jgi:hypothetical protein
VRRHKAITVTDQKEQHCERHRLHLPLGPHGRKGQICFVLARGKMNSCLVEFEDGYQMVTSRNALKGHEHSNPLGSSSSTPPGSAPRPCVD